MKDKRKIRREEKRYEAKSSSQIIMNFAFPMKLLFIRQASTSVMGYGKEHVGLKLLFS